MRQYWAYIGRHVIQPAGFRLLVVVAQRFLHGSVLVDNVALYLALVAVVRFAVLPILWGIERIVITDKRVMLTEGFIVHKVGMMPLSKVTDLTFERSIGGRMLGYGTLIVESAARSRRSTGSTTCPAPRRFTMPSPSSYSARRAIPAPPGCWPVRAGGADSTLLTRRG